MLPVGGRTVDTEVARHPPGRARSLSSDRIIGFRPIISRDALISAPLPWSRPHLHAESSSLPSEDAGK